MGLGRKDSETGLQRFCGEGSRTIRGAGRQWSGHEEGASRSGCGEQRARCYLTTHSRSEGGLFLLRGPGTRPRSEALGTRAQPEDMGLGFGGPQ